MLLLTTLAAAGDLPASHRPIHAEVSIGLAHAQGADLDEWLVPVFGGYEHGFTVYGADDDELAIHVGMRGADAFQDGEDLLFVTHGGDAIRYTDLLAWDADGRELPATMEPAPGGFRIVVDLVGATFPVTVDPLTSTPFAALQSAFGWSGQNVANVGDVNGDGRPDVLVGAPLTSNGNTYEGRVSLYYGAGLLTPFRGVDWRIECGADNCMLGDGNQPLAGVGDVNGDGYDDFAVGMPYKTGVGAYTGAVAVYYGSPAGPVGPTWIPATETTTPDYAALFGWAVDGGVDVNGDGYDDLIVGSPHASYDSSAGDLAQFGGCAEVFLGSSSGIATTPTARFEGRKYYDVCGWAVTGVGDIDSDGYDEIAFSCQWDYRGSDGLMDPGKIYVIAGGPFGSHTSYGQWTITGTTEFGLLGSGLDAGDVDGDGIPDLLAVSGYYAGSGGSNTTVGMAFRGTGAGLDTTAFWTAEGPAISYYYGASIAYVPDVNNDGWGEVAIGMPDYSSNYGTVNLYYGAAGGPATTADWTWTSDRAARAGISIAGLGNAVGLNTYGDFAIGAPGWDNNTADSLYEGRVFVFRGAP